MARFKIITTGPGGTDHSLEMETLGAIGAEYRLTRDPAGLREAHKIILPGVGHFGQMLRALDERQVREPLLDRIRAGVPFLGICLGLLALFEPSE